MGLVTDLELEGNQFANASTFFFVAYLIAELPTGVPATRSSHDFQRLTGLQASS